MEVHFGCREHAQLPQCCAEILETKEEIVLNDSPLNIISGMLLIIQAFPHSMDVIISQRELYYNSEIRVLSLDRKVTFKKKRKTEAHYTLCPPSFVFIQATKYINDQYMQHDSTSKAFIWSVMFLSQLDS